MTSANYGSNPIGAYDLSKVVDKFPKGRTESAFRLFSLLLLFAELLSRPASSSKPLHLPELACT